MHTRFRLHTQTPLSLAFSRGQPLGDGNGNQKPTRREKITEEAVNIVRAHINERSLKKLGTWVYQPREDYMWDYVYAEYESETMDFEMLINAVMVATSELATIIQGGEGTGANPWLFKVLVDAVTTMDLILPRLRRDRAYYGFQDGLLLVDSRTGPCCKWIRWTEAQRLDIVVRKYVDYRIEDKPLLYRMLVDLEDANCAELEALCPGFIRLFSDQGFNEVTFTWPDNEYESTLTNLVCGESGRLLYELHKHDQFRHAFAPWGRGGTGKSAAVEIVLQAFVDLAKIHQVTSSTEEIFGLANADSKDVISIPDAESRSRGFGISKSNFKLAAANEPVSIAIKHKDAKVAITMGAPIVSTSNDELYKVFGPFSNEADEQAVKDRILSVHYTKEFEGDERVKLADVIKKEAGAILVLIVHSYKEMISKAPLNSTLADWDFMPFLQEQAAAADPLREFILKNIEYKPRERQPDRTYQESTISLRALMGWDGTHGMGGCDGFDEMTSQEMDKRLPGVLASINTEHQYSFKYDKGETFYACESCKYDINKNKHTAAAAIFCCGQYEDAHGQDRFQLKDGCICYGAGSASEGKPKKFKTMPKKTIDADGVEGPDKKDVACIKNAIWRGSDS